MFLMCFDPGIIIPGMLLDFFFTEIQYNSIYDKNFLIVKTYRDYPMVLLIPCT